MQSVGSVKKEIRMEGTMQKIIEEFMELLCAVLGSTFVLGFLAWNLQESGPLHMLLLQYLDL